MAIPSSADSLRFGPLGPQTIHVCVDMQRLFAEDTEWKTPWMERVLPRVVALAEAHPERTIFTRFIPASRPGEGVGVWRRYWTRWSNMTLQALGGDMVELAPELAGLVPPAKVVDKRLYSPWIESRLEYELENQGADTLIISGGETDVCVLGTVLGGVDRGYRIVLATDALCSVSDETHEALLTVYKNRYGQQVETVPTETLIRAWS